MTHKEEYAFFVPPILVPPNLHIVFAQLNRVLVDSPSSLLFMQNPYSINRINQHIHLSNKNTLVSFFWSQFPSLVLLKQNFQPLSRPLLAHVTTKHTHLCTHRLLRIILDFPSHAIIVIPEHGYPCFFGWELRIQKICSFVLKNVLWWRQWDGTILL